MTEEPKKHQTTYTYMERPKREPKFFYFGPHESVSLVEALTNPLAPNKALKELMQDEQS
jgi:uncharacterized protein (DUF1778 family)